MGCVLSRPKEKYVATNDTESEDDIRSIDSRESTVSTSRFTVATSSNKRYEHNSGYVPGKNLNIDDEIERWKKKTKDKMARKEKEETSAADEFVFGDFKLSEENSLKEREGAGNRQRVMRRRSLSVHSKDKGDVLFNDFVLPTQVDEGDDPGYFQFREQKVPPGFVRMKGYYNRNLLGHSSRVKTLAIAPNDIEFASAAIEDCHLTMTSMQNDEEVGTFIGHSAPIISAVFSRDGRFLATSSRDNSVIIWNMSQKESSRKSVLTLKHPSLPICVCFSSDSATIITGCQDRVCRVWDVDTRELVSAYKEHEGVVVCATTVPGEDAAITGGGDRVIRMWTANSDPVTIRQFIGHDGVVISVNVTPDAEKLLSNDDRACKMWNVATGACVLNVTLEALTKNLSSSAPPPIPLPKNFLSHVPLCSKSLGYAPNGILGPKAVNACKIDSNKAVFTLSCLCPGELSCSYFAVACTNKMIYIVSFVTGKEELSFRVKSSVFAINPGHDTTLLVGDIYGNCYRFDLIPEGYDKDFEFT